MYAGELIGNIILGKHDLCNPCEILRFLIFYPQNLGRGKTGKGDIRRVLRELFLSDNVVQIVALLKSPSVIPQKRRTDDLILIIQYHKPMHLPAEADACYLIFIRLRHKLPDSLHGLGIPVLRILLRPPRIREINRILSGNNLSNLPLPVHQQQLYRAGAQVNAYVEHNSPPFTFLLFMSTHFYQNSRDFPLL